MPHAPPSPCRKLCRLEGAVCAGCGRTGAEIAQWVSADAALRRKILRRSRMRMAGMVPKTASDAR